MLGEAGSLGKCLQLELSINDHDFPPQKWGKSLVNLSGRDSSPTQRMMKSNVLQHPEVLSGEPLQSQGSELNRGQICFSHLTGCDIGPILAILFGISSHYLHF